MTHGSTARTTSPTGTTRAKITLPPVNGRFDYQIGDTYPPAASVTVVDRDVVASGKAEYHYENC